MQRGRAEGDCGCQVREKPSAPNEDLGGVGEVKTPTPIGKLKPYHAQAITSHP